MSDLCTLTRERLVELMDTERGEPLPEDLRTLQVHFDGCEACQAEGRRLNRLASLTRQALALRPRLAERKAADAEMEAGQAALIQELRRSSAWQTALRHLGQLEPGRRLVLLREAAARVLERFSLPESHLFPELWQAHQDLALAGGATRGAPADESVSGTDRGTAGETEGETPIRDADGLVALAFRTDQESSAAGRSTAGPRAAGDPVRTAFENEVLARLQDEP